jgi:MHS family proline/betaine transporter-like MFS transporter
MSETESSQVVTGSASAPPTSGRLDPSVRRAAAAGFAGTFVEYYDFALYGLLTVYFAPRFFPATNTVVSLLAGLAVLGAGFVARPVGGLIFGWVGDRYGRRRALVTSLALMGVCSGIVGLLPTYETLGVWAPVLLVLMRLGQGISAGSQMLGAVTLVLESAPRGRRIFLASLTPFGSGVGTAVATVAVFLLGLTAGSAWMASVGWRVLFLACFPLLLVALWIRVRMEDSPEFTRMVARRDVADSPIAEVLREHWRPLLLAGGVAIATNGASGLVAWFSTYLVGARGLAGSVVFAALAVTSTVSAFTIPVAGRLTSALGQRKSLAIIFAAYVLITVPFLLVIGGAARFLPLMLALLIYNILSVAFMPPAFTLIAQLFPARVRYTGANLAQNIGTVLGAGFAPLIAASLVLGTGTVLGAGLWIGLVMLIGSTSLVLLGRFTSTGSSGDDDLAG